MDINALIQVILENIIRILLPVALGYAVIWMNHKIQETKARFTADQLAFAEGVIKQFVLAAEQSGLTNAIKNEGQVKKEYVMRLADTELRKHGVILDLETIDVLIEAAVYDAFKKIEY